MDLDPRRRHFVDPLLRGRQGLHDDPGPNRGDGLPRLRLGEPDGGDALGDQPELRRNGLLCVPAVQLPRPDPRPVQRASGPGPAVRQERARQGRLRLLVADRQEVPQDPAFQQIPLHPRPRQTAGRIRRNADDGSGRGGGEADAGEVGQGVRPRRFAGGQTGQEDERAGGTS